MQKGAWLHPFFAERCLDFSQGFRRGVRIQLRQDGRRNPCLGELRSQERRTANAGEARNRGGVTDRAHIRGLGLARALCNVAEYSFAKPTLQTRAARREPTHWPCPDREFFVHRGPARVHFATGPRSHLPVNGGSVLRTRVCRQDTPYLNLTPASPKSRQLGGRVRPPASTVEPGGSLGKL